MELKKVLEVLAYLVAEVGLAYLTVKAIGLPPEVIAIIGAVYVWLGKVIIVKIKG